MSVIELAVTGRMFHAPTPDKLGIIDGVITVGADGVIVDVVHDASSPVAIELVSRARTVWRMAPHERLLPGLVDTHVHAPQWPQLGTGLDLPLESWLFDHTFPLEARYADVGFARDVWEHMVPTLLGLGTTTAVYYSSIHEDATRLLAERCAVGGQRAFVGRVAMDHPTGTPEWYRDESADVALERSRRSVRDVFEIGATSGLVKPILTPRFIPACSDELLAGMGRMADELGCTIQTHCSESDWEHANVRDRFGRSDTEMLDAFGLLRERTVLAHGNLVSTTDAALIRARVCGHRPLSVVELVLRQLRVAPATTSRRRCSGRTRIGRGRWSMARPVAAVRPCRHGVADVGRRRRRLDRRRLPWSLGLAHRFGDRFPRGDGRRRRDDRSRCRCVHPGSSVRRLRRRHDAIGERNA